MWDKADGTLSWPFTPYNAMHNNEWSSISSTSCAFIALTEKYVLCDSATWPL